jgi:hypothetical protein
MRKMMAQQAEMAAACGETVEEGETSPSDWSEDHDEAELGGANGVSRGDRPSNEREEKSSRNCRDSYNLDALSTAAAGGAVKDVEGAMSDVISLCDADDRGHDGDMDDTSMSSRGSPRMLNPSNVGEM